MSKIGSYRWEGKEKIRKDREIADRQEIDEATDPIRFVIDECRRRFDEHWDEIKEDVLHEDFDNGTPEVHDDPYFEYHTYDGPF